MRDTLRRRLLYGVALLATLLMQCADAAAPAGQWWDLNYGYRLQISIPAGPTALPTAYAVSFQFDHAAEIAAGRALASGNDVRVVYWNGTTWTDLDRVVDVESAWAGAASKIWFRTQALIAAAATDTNYYVYFGNATPATPLATAENVFSMFDDFSAATLTATRWAVTRGTATVAGGILTVNSASSVRAAAAYSYGVNTIWEAKVQLSTALAATYSYWTSSNTNDYTDDHVGFWATAAAHSYRYSVNNAVTTTAFTNTGAASYQIYAFTRETTSASRYFLNGSQLALVASGAPTNAHRALLWNQTAAQTQRYDWVRVRPYRNVEPVLSLSALDDNLIAAWYMGEASWNGTVDEVDDSGIFDLDGRAFGGAQTAGGVTGCRYGTFNGTSQYVEVPDNAAFDRTAELSVSVWVYPRSYGTELKSIVSKDDNYEFHLNATGQVYWWWNGGGTREITTTGTPVPLNQWTHIAITYESGVQRLYVNGVVRGTNNRAEVLPVNNLALQIGYDGAGSAQPGRFWDGYIDSVRIYGKALTAAQVTTAMTDTQPCPTNAHHLAISHDGYGIHCLAEQITVSPHDASHNAFMTYTESITLNTGTGNGDWALQGGSGTGTLNNGTANDGIATYQWVSGEANVIFLLTYRQGAASINITASSATISDDNTEGNIAWGASGFTVTAAALTNPPTLPITTFATSQIAGTAFTLHITAYGTTPTDTQCGVIETYTGVVGKSLKFWSTYVNPNSGTRIVTINGINASTTEAGSTIQPVVFTNGQASVTALYRDAGSINIAMKDDTVTPPVGGIRGATNDFVVRPASFVVSNILRTSDSAVNPAASAATGPVFIQAGAAFTATATAVDFNGNTTPNFGRETPAESVRLQSNLVLPSPGINPAVASNFGTFTNGVATATTFSWGEVGIITLTPRLLDGDYLGAGDVVGTTTGNVGRFIPFNFGVTASAASFAPACAASGYVYLGQPLSYAVPPVLTLTARAFGGGTTLNYQGAFYKLVNGTPTTRTYSTSSGTLVQPAASATDPAQSTLGNGMATLTFNVASGLTFSRTVLPASPDIPFTPTLALNATVLDTDGVAASTNVNLASTNPFVVNGITSPEQRHGRIAFRNVVGSELLNLPVPMQAEYFLSAAAGFVRNTNDSCTTGVTVSLAAALSAGGTTCLLDAGSCPGPIGQQFQMPPAAGDFVAILRAPGATHGGTVTITTVVPSWLRYDWNTATPLEENPSAVVNFGLFKGEAKRIFQIEK